MKAGSAIKQQARANARMEDGIVFISEVKEKNYAGWQANERKGNEPRNHTKQHKII
jgi:hypothetical protein